MAGELGYDTGPYVNAAAFCEQAIEDKDGGLSIVKMVDQLTVAAQGPNAPQDLPAGALLNTTLVLNLKPGEARGRQDVTVTIVHPDGITRISGPKLPAHFTGGPNNGQNFILKLGLQLSTAGLYWAEVAVNDRLVTKVPLEIRYEISP